jgi:thiamine biosynthesis lipoprotein
VERNFGKAFTTVLAVALVLLAIIRLGGIQDKTLASGLRSRIMMDTVVSIRVYSGDARQIDDALQAAFAEMERLDGLLSAWNSDSDISKINRAAGKEMVPVDQQTWLAVNTIQALSGLTQGSFDITIGAVSRLWDFSSPQAVPPARETIEKALRMVGSHQVLLDSTNHRIGLRQAGASIDLGGAAKGYIVDRAIEVLRERGVESAVVDAGGDIGLLGQKEDGRAWKIGIKHPQNPGTTIEIIDVDCPAVATSGNYERFFIQDQIRYHHILDPKTGLPAPDVVSATVLAQTAVEADLLATAVFVLGPIRGMTLIEQLAGVEGVIYVEGPEGLKRVASSNFPPSKEDFKISEAHLSPRRS